ncbi:DUF305 domain-containing protein [Noviherbaspirillum soli]|uniref:DUF305 domain-containing protein n=1 Tax=Noviherbaspirillum soli TaxID=1064518 RepID=UPI002B275B7E|nr:DUF305 domain-containing protein [Noviherbaspirillum soli]
MVEILSFEGGLNRPFYPRTRVTSGAMRSVSKVLFALGATAILSIAAPAANASGPGRGVTADFEKAYLEFIIDHHYSALRMTELAAGTDLQRDAPVDNAQEGTAPTPNTNPTPAKATDDQIKSMSRQANRTQREEILKAQRFLRDWYGVNHTPQLQPQGRQAIQQLEQTATGTEFNRTFLQTFSNHHYRALFPSLACQVKRDIDHDELERYCSGIVHSQTNQINDMREMLCKKFSICDFVPTANLGPALRLINQP